MLLNLIYLQSLLNRIFLDLDSDLYGIRYAIQKADFCDWSCNNDYVIMSFIFYVVFLIHRLPSLHYLLCPSFFLITNLYPFNTNPLYIVFLAYL